MTSGWNIEFVCDTCSAHYERAVLSRELIIGRTKRWEEAEALGWTTDYDWPGPSHWCPDCSKARKEIIPEATVVISNDTVTITRLGPD